MSTTPTGIPVTVCGLCGHRHPVTRTHCGTCGLAHVFPCPPTGARLPARTTAALRPTTARPNSPRPAQGRNEGKA